MGALIVQNDFTHGEIDPQLRSRPDLALFSKSAQMMRNVVVSQTGGAKRRFGTNYTDKFATASFTHMDYFDYDEDTQYLLVFRSTKIYIYKNDVKVAEVAHTYDPAIFENNQLKTTRTKNSLVIVHPDYPPAQLVRGADDATWVLSNIVFKIEPAHDFRGDYNAATFTLGVKTITNSTTLASNIDVFVPEHEGGIFIGIGTADVEEDGFARITQYVNSKLVNVSIKQEFGNTVLNGNECYLGEVAWGADPARGWPQSATFYEGRLVFGGSKALPSTIFMSVTNDYLNFDVGTGLEDESIQLTIATDAINSIKYVVSDRSFQIFTTDGEFVSPQSESSPLTPGNTSFRKQTNNGISDVEPLVMDNQTFFVRKGGKAILGFLYDNDRGSYQASTASLLSPHLILNPQDGAVLSGSPIDAANYLMYINEDGSLVVFQSLQEQNIAGWTLSTTDGLFKKITSVGSDIYFIVSRTIGGTAYDFLEKLSWDDYTDCTIHKTLVPAGTTVTGLDALEGKTVQVRADGYVFQPRIVTGGQIELEDDATNIAVGLEFNPLIRPNPVQVSTQEGSSLYKKKRIVRAWIDYYDSIGIYVNDTLIPYQDFGDPLDQPPQTQEGVFEYSNLTDWLVRESVDITQQEPLPMTILGIGYEVEV